MLAKREVTKEYDELFLYGARTLENYCRMVGKVELADRIRSSVRRVRGTNAEETESQESQEPARLDSALMFCRWSSLKCQEGSSSDSLFSSSSFWPP